MGSAREGAGAPCLHPPLCKTTAVRNADPLGPSERRVGVAPPLDPRACSTTGPWPNGAVCVQTLCNDPPLVKR